MSQFNNPNWIGFDGQPITGRVPPQVLVSSQPPGLQLTSEQQGQMRHDFKLFTDAVAVSAIPDGFHVRHRDYPQHGMWLRMESRLGQERVFVRLVSGSEQEEGQSMFAWVFLNAGGAMYSSPFAADGTPTLYGTPPYLTLETSHREYYAALFGDPNGWKSAAEHWATYGELAPPVFGPFTTQCGAPGKGGGRTLSFGAPSRPWSRTLRSINGKSYAVNIDTKYHQFLSLFFYPTYFDSRPFARAHEKLQSVARTHGTTYSGDPSASLTASEYNIVTGVAIANGHTVVFSTNSHTPAGVSDPGKLYVKTFTGAGPDTYLPLTNPPVLGDALAAWDFSHDGLRAITVDSAGAVIRAVIQLGGDGVPNAVEFVRDESMVVDTTASGANEYALPWSAPAGTRSGCVLAGYDALDREVLILSSVTYVRGDSMEGGLPPYSSTFSAWTTAPGSFSATRTLASSWTSTQHLVVDGASRLICTSSGNHSGGDDITHVFSAPINDEFGVQKYCRHRHTTENNAVTFSGTVEAIRHFDIKSLRWVKMRGSFSTTFSVSAAFSNPPPVAYGGSRSWSWDRMFVYELMRGTELCGDVHAEAESGSASDSLPGTYSSAALTNDNFTRTVIFPGARDGHALPEHYFLNAGFTGAPDITLGHGACDGRWLLTGVLTIDGLAEPKVKSVAVDLTQPGDRIRDLNMTAPGFYSPETTTALACVGPDWYVPKYMPFTEPPP